MGEMERDRETEEGRRASEQVSNEHGQHIRLAARR
jgi:hypothetical protein